MDDREVLTKLPRIILQDMKIFLKHWSLKLSRAFKKQDRERGSQVWSKQSELQSSYGT